MGPHAAAEHAARQSYGRLLAYLAYQWRDIAAAEDALSDAFVSALQTWPKSGVPDSPDAWLMTAARRHLLQVHRHKKVAEDPALTVLLADPEGPMPELPAFPDERLKLLLVCAHPAIDPTIHTALMLQTVLGLDARQIASAFLVSPATMAQRLVRAKNKIKKAGIRFEQPEADDLAERVHAVLEAIYAAYCLGWEALDTDTLGVEQASNLVSEAIYLADLTASLLPRNPEAAGLLALLLFCESRRGARHGPGGEFVPLHEQDARLWDHDLIRQADNILWVAAAQHQSGPFQLEAAIQAAHCHRAFTGQVPWAGIVQLYDRLVQQAPTTGARVSRAVALAESGALLDGLAALDALSPAAVTGYQPYWVARAHLLAKAGQATPAADSYQRALGLTTLPSVRAHLLQRLHALQG